MQILPNTIVCSTVLKGRYGMDTVVEVAAFLTGLFYIFLAVRQKSAAWPFGIVNALLYVYVFFQSKFYADMGLQVYYVLAGVYGWIHWSRTRSDSLSVVPVTRLTLLSGLILLAVCGGLFAGIAHILSRYTDSPLPHWDAFTTAVGFVATWMLARKIYENWMLWVVVDAVCVGLYIYRQLYFTAALFAVFTVLAVAGLVRWRTDMRPQTSESAR